MSDNTTNSKYVYKISDNNSVTEVYDPLNANKRIATISHSEDCSIFYLSLSDYPIFRSIVTHVRGSPHDLDKYVDAMKVFLKQLNTVGHVSYDNLNSEHSGKGKQPDQYCR